MKRRALATMAVLLALPGPAAADPPPEAKGTPGLLSQAYWNDVPTATEVATHDGVGEGVKQFGKVCLEEADELEKAGAKVLDAAGKPNLSGAMREKGLKLYGEGRQAAKLNRTAGGWAKGLGKALDRINIVATFAKSAGHAVEGDLPGTVEVVVDEAAKKATTTTMAAGGGLIGGPLGSVGGAMAGEEVHERYTRPAIQKKADDWRQARANERYLNNTPPHKREKALTEEKRLKDELDRTDRDEGKEPEARPDGGLDILALVTPAVLHAKGRTEEDVSAGEFKNVVTTVVQLTFHNVGSLAPGYGKAILGSRSTASLNGTQTSSSCQGIFSGGPNGAFRLICDRSVVNMRLVNGQHVVGPDGVRLQVDNPGAFKDWPVKK